MKFKQQGMNFMSISREIERMDGWKEGMYACEEAIGRLWGSKDCRGSS
jgi:hypothetical protein